MAHPIALASPRLVELIKYIIKAHTIPSTLIICTSRESFLGNLQAHFHRSDSASLHPLLVPTIHLLAATRTIRLAFIPTLGHLRAYLATFQSTLETATHSSRYQSLGPSSPMLFIFGLVALHHSTNEYSAQGLSRSLALAVEAANNTDGRLVLVEHSKEDENGGLNNDIEENHIQKEPWSDQVPLLNESIRLGGEDRVWSGRTVEIGRIVGRWCKFEALDADDADG